MSDSMNCRGGLVVGTAGHIDHGKTSLVRALTGIDTDRLAEEKRRGISIDLGFAHLALPGGITVGFIDVPGHERFVRNMLAGAAGIEAVMLVVAANESVMPQTREHFDICRLLGIRRGFVVLTKVDLVSQDQIRATSQEIRALIAGSFLEGCAIVPASAATGQGLTEVRSELQRLGQTARATRDGKVARLPVDRSFSVKGFGTVITGTLWTGALRSGDDIFVHPSNKSGRIRSMQIHGHSVDTGIAGQRTAINLAGIDASSIKRGDTLTAAEQLDDTHVMDVWIEWLDSRAIPERRAELQFHLGTAEVLAQCKVLYAANGCRTFGRLWLPSPVLALPGDHFVLRRPSPAQTVGGGQVLDPFPPVRLNRLRTIERLERLAGADDASRIELLVSEAPTGRRVEELLRATGLSRERIRELAIANPSLLFVEAHSVVITKAWLGERRNRLANWLSAFHAKNPSLAGAPLAQARLGLRPELASIVFERFPAIRVQGETVSLATHKAVFSDQDSRVMARIEGVFRDAGFQPPTITEVLSAALRDAQKARSLLEILVKSKRLVRISDDLIFHADVMAHVRNSLAAHRGRRFSVPEFKEWTHMSRKYAIPVLEYLDREHITRRDGDQRVIL